MVVGINVDRGNRAGVARFTEQIHADFSCLLDSAGNVRNRYRIRVLPTSYLIDRDGRTVGERNWESPAAERMIYMLLGK